MMVRDPKAFAAGVEEAHRDVAVGNLRLHLGARGEWGRELTETLLSRFGVELVVLSCFVTDASGSFVAGYNATVTEHIDHQFGVGAVAMAIQEVERRRKERYDAWFPAITSTDKPK